MKSMFIILDLHILTVFRKKIIGINLQENTIPVFLLQNWI